jgi:glycosyltransferase involved in cell wall biosynthesis
MKILMLNPYMPYPPSQGGQVRSLNLIKHLSKNHDIYLLSLVKNDEEARYKAELMKYCKEVYTCKRSESPWTVANVMKSILGKYPLLINRNYSPEARETIERLLKENTFDLIHAETFYIMPHIPETDIPIFLVEQTIEYRVFQHYVQNQVKIPFLRPFFWPDTVKLKFWEKAFWKKADLVGAVSEADADQMHELLPNLNIKIVPNAAGEDLLDIYSTRSNTVKPIFLYIGNYSWLQNVEGAQILKDTIFPLIKKRIPGAQCIIAGQRAYEKLGKEGGQGIEIVDIDPSDVHGVVEAYTRGHIFLAPLKGPGGTRLKILGAMAAGMPVISSETGVGGLDVHHGENCYIAQTPKDYADYAYMLLNDKKEYMKIRKNGRKLVDDVYSWRGVSRNLETIYKELISSK